MEAKKCISKRGFMGKRIFILQDLSRVEKVEVKFGHEIKTWYLNLTQEMSSTLKGIGKKDLFKEVVRLTEP